MINHLNGKLIEKHPSHLIVECGGVGYFVNISLNTFEKIPNKEAIKIFIHLSIRDDAHVLFGFAEESERVMFRQLISVSGIGPSTAIVILSALGPHQIKEALLNEEVALLQTIKGIGGKTAQRMVVELKDKMEKDTKIQLSITGTQSGLKKETLAALQVLGFDRKRIEKTIDRVLKTHPEDVKVETIIKSVLKAM
ncbi:MAG: Holliday junction branch migration protein RuvA [Bacteroidetes bacterium]|nr:MAG: Holliday junction branch migration protein RuvA [Bacteroidota bacterium]